MKKYWGFLGISAAILFLLLMYWGYLHILSITSVEYGIQNTGNIDNKGTPYNTKPESTPIDCFVFTDGSIDGYSNTCPKNVIIPENINGIKVASIGKNAFSWKQLSGVIIPDSVTSIGDRAFQSNNLTSVVVPDSVTSIGMSSFHVNNLTSIVLGKSLVSIGSYAFAQNKLTSVNIPNSLTFIGGGIFSDNKLTSVTIPSSITTIGEGAFNKNQLTSITIPDSVSSISGFAFSDNQLTSINIPNSVTSIGEGAFSENKLTSISIPSSVASIGEGAFSDNGPDSNSMDISNFVAGIEQSRDIDINNGWYKTKPIEPKITTTKESTGNDLKDTPYTDEEIAMIISTTKKIDTIWANSEYISTKQLVLIRNLPMVESADFDGHALSVHFKNGGAMYWLVNHR